MVESLSHAYAGRSVLVTGGASFIGSHLVERLVDLGAEVIVVDDFSSGKRENLATLPADRILEFDLADRVRTFSGPAEPVRLCSISPLSTAGAGSSTPIRSRCL